MPQKAIARLPHVCAAKRPLQGFLCICREGPLRGFFCICLNKAAHLRVLKHYRNEHIETAHIASL